MKSQVLFKQVERKTFEMLSADIWIQQVNG